MKRGNSSFASSARRGQFLLDRRQFLGAVAASSVVLTPAKRPTLGQNVVMIVIDGWRSEMMGCAGNRLLQTPHIDALAQRSVRFNNSFSAYTVCMPARASLLTGRYPTVNGVRCNGVPLRKSEVTLADVLEKRGYATAAIGKLHLEPQQRPGFPGYAEPGHSYYGFEEIHITSNRLGPEYLSYVKLNFPDLLEAIQKLNAFQTAGGGKLNYPNLLEAIQKLKATHLTGRTIPEEATDVYWVVSETLRYIERKCRDSTPFFVQCSFQELIPPEHPPSPFDHLYKPGDMPMPKRRPSELATKPAIYKKVYDNQMAMGYYPSDDDYRRIMAGYYGEMSFLDKQIGRILDHLESLNLLENTMVVLTGDHGLCLGDHWVYRHGPWPYDLDIKVPLIIYQPHMKGNRVLKNIVESVDIMPTILDWLGLPIPPGVQGRSLGSAISEDVKSGPEETAWLVCREDPQLDTYHVGSKGFYMTLLRSRDWKYVQYAGQSLGELYDLRNDPDEFVNRWEEPRYGHVRDEYCNRLAERMMTAYDPLPVRKYDW